MSVILRIYLYINVTLSKLFLPFSIQNLVLKNIITFFVKGTVPPEFYQINKKLFSIKYHHVTDVVVKRGWRGLNSTTMHQYLTLCIKEMYLLLFTFTFTFFVRFSCLQG